MKLMTKLTYILPTFCLILSLASILMMYVRLNRIKAEYAVARQEARQLNAEIQQANKRLEKTPARRTTTS